MTSKKRYGHAVYIGRFQPFHLGHAELLDRALAIANNVIVVLGSAFQARTPKNPFTWEERANMIRAALPAEAAARVDFMPVRDYYDDQRWVSAVTAGVLARTAGKAPALVGHFKDDSSYYLSRFNWELVNCDRAGQTDATALRNVLFDEEAMPGGLALLASRVPPAVLQFLGAFQHLPEYARLLAECKQIKKDKSAWKKSPYEPIFSTADAIVKMNQQVLLIRRGQGLGKGLLALPGGFVEPKERVLQAALRELREETNFGMYENSLRDALSAVAVFDHPERSLRGRTITHAHFFDLGDRLPLGVQGNGAEGVPQWVPVSELLQMENQFFEDHFHILDHFLNITG